MQRKNTLAAGLVLILAACSTTGVVPLEQNRFMVAVTSAKFGFVGADKEKAKCYRLANEYCAKTGRTVKTESVEAVGSGFGRPARANLEFSCVDKSQ